ncbi:class III lanthionine synthetase LanKC N-terminal domain-containing protein [Microbacterium memoriense]
MNVLCGAVGLSESARQRHQCFRARGERPRSEGSGWGPRLVGSRVLKTGQCAPTDASRRTFWGSGGTGSCGILDEPSVPGRTQAVNAALFRPDEGRDWTSWRSGSDRHWVHWLAPGATLPEQGWKIHISTTPSGGEEMLRDVSAFCHDHGVPFKHLRDMSVLAAPVPGNTVCWQRFAACVVRSGVGCGGSPCGIGSALRPGPSPWASLVFGADGVRGQRAD